MKNVLKHDHAFAIKLEAWPVGSEPRQRTHEEGPLAVRDGEEVILYVYYENTDRQQRLQEKVKVAVELPEQLEYVPGSTTMTDCFFSETKLLDDGVASGGVEIGDYAPGAWAEVQLKVRAVAKRMMYRELAVMPWAHGEVSCAVMQDFAKTVIVVRKA